jgi:hypothetical protein
MHDRSRKKPGRKDLNELASLIVEHATKDKPEPSEAEELTEEMEQAIAEGKNPAAVALGRLGGRKGGPARAKKLTAEERREIAKKAARARWSKAKENKK